MIEALSYIFDNMQNEKFTSIELPNKILVLDQFLLWRQMQEEDISVPNQNCSTSVFKKRHPCHVFPLLSSGFAQAHIQGYLRAVCFITLLLGN